MTVTKLWSGGRYWDVTGTGYEPSGEFLENGKSVLPEQNRELAQLLSFGLLASHAEIVERKEEKRFKKSQTDYVLDGDPTEGALVVAAKKAGYSREGLTKQYQVIHEFPFDSTRKMMSVIVRDRSGKRILITKGAPDVISSRTSLILKRDRSERMSAKGKQELEEAVATMAGEALRTIAIAFRVLDPHEMIQTADQTEKELTFIGIQAMIDPPRPEVKDSIAECREAGIRTVMITGDHKITASAIARQLNILPNGGLVVDGQTLSKMSDEELVEQIDRIFVFARVSPQHKLRIVQALQANGHIVAMTGDGVNDAPAIKAANIGIAMGITGTDVAKEASSLILSDDNFATIKEAIKEGRNIYENIRKFIRYMMASNVGEILVMLFAMILGLPLPLNDSNSMGESCDRWSSCNGSWNGSGRRRRDEAQAEKPK